MRSSSQTAMYLLAATCIFGLTLSLALAQPGRGFGQREPGMAETPFAGDPADHLRQRLETIDAERAQINDAINRLDAGEPWSEVRADIQMRRGGAGDDAQRPQERQRGKMDESRMIELLTEIDPEAAERLGQLRDRNPRFAGRLLQSMGPRLGDLARLRESNPPLFEVQAEEFRIERRIMLTARTMHMAIAGVDNPDPNVSVEETRTQLRELVGRQLDLQVEGKRIQLGSAEDRIERLRASIEEHAETRDAVIDDRVERIMERAVRGGVNRRQHGGGPDGGPPQRGQRRGRPDRP